MRNRAKQILALIAASLLVMLAATDAWALEPNEIVVIVNSNSLESVALGKFYCVKRHVPADNLVALDLPVADDISPDDYDNKLAKPLRQQLTDRKLMDSVRCLLTMRGVPFRLLERPRDPRNQMMLDWYRAAADRGQKRIQEDMRLLETVARTFPAAVENVNELTDRNKLFDALPPASAPASGPAPVELNPKDRFWSTVQTKIAEIHRLGPGAGHHRSQATAGAGIRSFRHGRFDSGPADGFASRSPPAGRNHAPRRTRATESRA